MYSVNQGHWRHRKSGSKLQVMFTVWTLSFVICYPSRPSDPLAVYFQRISSVQIRPDYTMRHGKCSMSSNFLCYAVPHNKFPVFLENTCLYFVLQQVFSLSLFFSFLLRLIPHSYFWMSLYSITMCLQRLYTIKPATGSVALYFHTKRLKEKQQKRL
jgi:hypothetical protein